jgi:thiamine-phosphate pyrophosphorylase
MPRRLVLPHLYPILDAGLLQHAGIALEAFAGDLRAAGIRWLQFRDKDAPDELLLQRALRLRQLFPPHDSQLILNDRVSLMQASGYEGVHIGQQDLSPVEARALLGADRLIGLSTHSEQQLLSANQAPVDYVAIGPVFATQSKAVPDPVVGLEGVRRARALTGKPLVAIGGITRPNCAAVLAAGADSVAVISDLLPHGLQTTRDLVREFHQRLAEAAHRNAPTGNK